MISVVRTILVDVGTSQLSLWVPQVGMVNHSSCHMGGTGHQLLEAHITEKLGDDIVGLLVKADVEVACDDRQSVEAHQLLQILDHLLLAPPSRPVENIS